MIYLRCEEASVRVRRIFSQFAKSSLEDYSLGSDIFQRFSAIDILYTERVCGSLRFLEGEGIYHNPVYHGQYKNHRNFYHFLQVLELQLATQYVYPRGPSTRNVLQTTKMSFQCVNTYSCCI